MTRVRRIGKRRRDTELPDAVRVFLETGEVPSDGEPMQTFALRRTAPTLWQEWSEEILADFVAERPGQRPWGWWKFSAPEPRRRLGGVGTPKHEVLAYSPTYAYGIPVYWITEWEFRYYTGRAVDVHGQPIGQEFRGHGLLAADERADLPAEAFEPELVLAGDDEDGA
jgi:hypothetical protein